MRSALDRICFTIANNQSTDNPDHPTGTQSAGIEHPITKVNVTRSRHDDSRRQQTRYLPSGREINDALVDGYTQLVTDRVRAGWSCHLVTVVFYQMPGPQGAVIGRMRDEVQRIYSTLVTRVHRKPRAASADQLPVLLGALDLPVYKRDRASSPMVLCNGGLHVHALVLMPPGSRLTEPLADHFQENLEAVCRIGKVHPAHRCPARDPRPFPAGRLFL